MNPLLEKIPPGHVWIEVEDFPSALAALSTLIEQNLQFNAGSAADDSDTN